MFDKPFWSSTNVAASSRKTAIKIIILLLFISCFARLLQLQVVESGLYANKSQAQTIKKTSIIPIRGMMYDRNGRLLVHNIATFSVAITPHDFNPLCMPLLCDILTIDSSKIRDILNKYQNAAGFTPIRVQRDISPEIVARLTEIADKLYGVDIIVDSKRTYEFDCNMAHMVGYTREISEEQLKKYQYYKPGDMIGQEGLEQSYETYLHGKDGVNFIAIDKLGRRVEAFSIKTAEKDTPQPAGNDTRLGRTQFPANNGFDLNLSIDIELQEYTEELLAGARGAVVALDPNDGEVLVFASKPDFDPRIFSGRVSPEVYSKLNTDKALPLFPRALRSEYPPGSTWKMLIALAGLQEGLISANSTYTCTGAYYVGNRPWKCHSACGALNVKSALRSSCNPFFCNLCVRLGMERFEKYGEMFGFGKRTHIDLPFESEGLLPSMQYWQKRDPNLKNFAGHLANYGIGQGEILVTPLQMATYTATIANGGTYYQPHIVRSIYNTQTKKVEIAGYDAKQIPIKKEHFDVVRDGMWRVVNAGGTGATVLLPGYDVCGKTGTAQNSTRRDHSWFVCFAPKDNPQIALCVFVESGGFGAAAAAPIAKKMLQKFFGIVPEIVIPNEALDAEDVQLTAQ